MFSNIEVNPRPDEKNEGGIIVEIKLKELEQKPVEVSTEWSIVPGRQGRPTLASIQPGGTVTFEHRNIKGLDRSILGSVTLSNLLNPQEQVIELIWRCFMQDIILKENRIYTGLSPSGRKKGRAQE
ncbi:hypothetical protein KSP39_PZI015189 [Platanthera zijinensis]|uniref:Toc75-like POTRA domain-containing protein n=1 Tax=Platanthera zijinensis TaxID=2320716 RepID=A0AAP0B953_9ASPA